MKNRFKTYETAWCPGCGNFSILECLKSALEDLGKDPHEVLIAAGIGQAAKTPQYINVNAFCGLHGRGVPPAVGSKIANEKLTVIVNTGDGDSYGEGGNHFIHNIRRNVNIAHIIHDNQVYGLTKGQASPTSLKGMVTEVQIDGNINIPFNPLLIAIASGAGFVARGFTGKKDHLTKLIKQAIQYKGYAVLDILQPCVSFNKINTFDWYNQRVYELDDQYDPYEQMSAIKKSMEFGDRIPIGLIYYEEKPTFHEKNNVLKKVDTLIDTNIESSLVNKYIHEFV